MIEKYNFLLQITLVAHGNGNITKMTVLCYAGRQRKTVQKLANNLKNRPLTDFHRNHLF